MNRDFFQTYIGKMLFIHVIYSFIDPSFTPYQVLRNLLKFLPNSEPTPESIKFQMTTIFAKQFNLNGVQSQIITNLAFQIHHLVK